MENNPKPERIVAFKDKQSDEARLYSPSVARNRDGIRSTFMETMDAKGHILEIASGTGEHAVFIAKSMPNLMWYPGDPDPTARRSITAWIGASDVSNVQPPHMIDTTRDAWPHETDILFDGLVSINMIHIAPRAAMSGLFEGGRKVLKKGGRLFLYGPFSRNGIHTAASNAAFDASLKSRNVDWGVRDLENDIIPLATANNMDLVRVIDMPANNFSLVFEHGD
ncbi:MAG: DUF938 domain-containing protein [Pseudomonadota bacterium]